MAGDRINCRGKPHQLAAAAEQSPFVYAQAHFATLATLAQISAGAVMRPPAENSKEVSRINFLSKCTRDCNGAIF